MPTATLLTFLTILACVVLTLVPGVRILGALVKLGVKLFRGYRNGVAAGRCLLWFICFAAGTQVATADGSVPIEDVTVGTMVWSLDPASGDWALRPVMAVFISDYEGLIVEIDILAADSTTETITTTAEHPFLVASGEQLRSSPPVGDWPAGAT